MARSSLLPSLCFPKILPQSALLTLRLGDECLEVVNIFRKIIAAVDPAGYVVAAEYHRPGGLTGSGDKAEIVVEMWLRAGLSDILPCDF